MFQTYFKVEKKVNEKHIRIEPVYAIQNCDAIESSVETINVLV